MSQLSTAQRLLLNAVKPTSSRSLATSSSALPSLAQPYVHLPLVHFTKSESPREAQLVPLPTPLFNIPPHPTLLHKLIISHLASLRAGTAATKNRSQVNYSGKKLRPQKGTGGARLGSRGSPMLRGGGRAFGKTPKGPDGWARKVNRKEEQLGLRVAASEKWRSGNLIIVDRLALDEVSTRLLAQKLKSRGWTDALFVMAKDGVNDTDLEREQKDAFELASGNIPSVSLVTDSTDLKVWDVVRRKKTVIELSAVDELIARMDPDGRFEDLEEDAEGWTIGEEEVAKELEEALKGVDLNH